MRRPTRPFGVRRLRARLVPLRAADQALSRDLAMARLEVILLVADGSLSSRRLAELAGLADGTQARTLVRRLNERYDGIGHNPAQHERAKQGAARDGTASDGRSSRGSGEEATAFRVEEVAGGFQLMTRPCFHPWLRRLHDLPAGVRLSTSALETLAVIAYRQPVVRAELEAIRGVQCGEMLRQLSERDLVRMAGRSSELGRPFLYSTTKKFLQVFGLRSLDELPRAQSLRRGTVATPSKPMLLQVSQDPRDTPEESPVKIAIFPDVDPAQEELLAFPIAASLSDRTVVDPRADEDFEDEEDEGEDDDDVEDEEDDLEEDDLEEEEWEEVEDDEEDEDWEEEDDEDWDDDEDEDWEEEEEEEGEE